MVRSTLDSRWWEPEQPKPASPGNFERTGGGRDRFQIAIDYSARDALLAAAGRPTESSLCERRAAP